jgi:dTDP-glucose 4,6-dehydratase
MGLTCFQKKIIPLFITNLLAEKKVPVYGDGMQVRDWIYVDDHVSGVLAVLERGRIGETYCLGGFESEVTNLDLTKKLLALLGKDESLIEYVKDRPGHDRRYSIDYAKTTRELGWQPTVSLDDGLQRTVDWYRHHADWVEHCKNGDYQAYYSKQYGNA